MPGQSHSRDRRDRDRRREYIRGHYEEDEGATSSPAYRFRETEYESNSHDNLERDEYEEERAQRRERRRRRREEEGALAYGSPGRRRDRDRERERERRGSRARESPGSPVKRHRDRDAGRGYRREGSGSPMRERRTRDGETDAEVEARRRRRRERERQRERERERELDAIAAAPARKKKHRSTESSNSASHLLSADAMARLAAEQEEMERREQAREADEIRRERRRERKRAAMAAAAGGELGGEVLKGRSRHNAGARVVSGAHLEEGYSSDARVRRRGGGGPVMAEHWKEEDSWEGSYESGGAPAWKFWANWSRKRCIIMACLLAVALLLAIIIPVAVVVSKKKGSDSNSKSSSTSSSSDDPTSNLDDISRDSIPSYAKGTVLDPFSWYETTGFNLTFTNATVGGLSLMGIDSAWDDSTRPNDDVPPLNEPFPYGSRPIRGVNLGGWLSIEPFITPSLFTRWGSKDGVIDEYTLTKKLGSSSAARTLEKHYATFITESDIKEIRDAGLDHVRIPYSYWAVKTYEGDPYVPKIAWRYLLRTIEWCRKYGLRIKLDLHGVPGSQNGWNHSGRQGSINWLAGSDGDLNRKRSLEIHDQLSQFFAQDRYKNVVTIYGLANEPLMLSLPVEKVLDWTDEAAKLVRKNGITATIVLHDGFLNLNKWDNMFKSHPDNMYLDTHQYTTFNTAEIALNHTAKVDKICNSWYPMLKEINTTTSGWGPTICGEWSQADTDCAQFVNNVGRGTRWEGTYDTSTDTLKAYCPTASQGTCSCADANMDPSKYSDHYKKFLQTYAEAQMSAFETAMGWFYWTWRTESAAQWSYRTAWKNGYMPEKAYSPAFKCGDKLPDFSDAVESY
ncbi:Glycoside hydrolase superfamily [Penicillium bovifimosum]|uniref:glucan 1,3-beta-glucosidase n=1 Tax=Penicillium bovifimosum TaxID=126998 RepID=A0A9W9L068_9EURO|nr:Glycoside hydrolase superfamily [Penicillium bovifimosum]KAJ5129455.1 Glycoside hydrolase superfamily [Penicillium bovifimosum]